MWIRKKKAVIKRRYIYRVFHRTATVITHSPQQLMEPSLK
jgi:hypothetical protein